MLLLLLLTTLVYASVDRPCLDSAYYSCVTRKWSNKLDCLKVYLVNNCNLTAAEAVCPARALENKGWCHGTAINPDRCEMTYRWELDVLCKI